MLNYLRRHAGSWMIKALLVGIALSFVIGFGILPALRNKGGEDLVVAKIGRRVISRGEWDLAYENLRRFYQEIYKDRFSEEMVKQLQLRETALDKLINQALQLEEAKRLHIQASDTEVQDRIRALPYFQRDGLFSRELYLNLLRRNSLAPSEFERQQRDELRVEKLQQLMLATVRVSEQELWDQYVLEKEEISLRAVKLAPADFEDGVEVSDDKLKAFFQSHSEDFLTPERVRVEVLEIDPRLYQDQVTVYTGNIEEYYDSHYDEFSRPEEVRLRHILLQVPKEAGAPVREEKRRQLENLREKVQQGEDFAALARKVSEDRATAGRGGDLGMVKKGDLAPEVEKAAFSLKPGEVSGVVASPFGLHLLKVEEHLEERVDPLDEVREKIREELKGQEAWRQARKKAEEVIWKSKEGADLKEAAGGDAAGPVPRQTGWFSRGEAVEGLSGDESMQQVIFALKPGEVSQAVKGKTGYYVFRLLERRAPEAPPFEEVKDRLEKPFRAEAARELARAKAEELAERLAKGERFETIAGEGGAGLVAIDTGLFSRLRTFVPKVGASADLVESAFSLSQEDPAAKKAFEVNGVFYLVRLQDRKTPERTAFLAEQESFRRRQEQKKKEEILRQWLSDLRQRQQVEIKGVS